MKNEYLKGNFELDKKIELEKDYQKKNQRNKEYESKVLNSIGGSMVFVEREILSWDPEKNEE